MPKFEIDTEKLQLAVQLYDYSQKQIEESFFKFKSLNNEFQTDMQLQLSPEYPQIQEIATRFLNSANILNDRMRELYYVYLRIPDVFAQLEANSKNHLEDVVVRSDCAQRNMNDVAGISLDVAKQEDEEVKAFSETFYLVENNSFNMSLASTATASGIIDGTYAGEDVLQSDLLVSEQVRNSTVSLEASLMDSLEEAENE